MRLKIGDTVSEDPQLSDEEIAYFLGSGTGSGAVQKASIDACKSLAARYARYPDTDVVGAGSVKAGELSAKYTALAQQLQVELATQGSLIVTGQSISTNAGYSQDTDRLQPEAYRDQDCYAPAGAPPYRAIP